MTIEIASTSSLTTLHLKEVLRYLFLEAEKYLTENVEYKKIRTSTMAMVNQSAIEYTNESGQIQRLHFRHHGIYVALSHMRAIVYASTNKFGTEILQRCVALLTMLKEEISDFVIPAEINLFKIDTFLSCNPEPIIIEVSDIDDYDLGKEDGKTAKEALDFLRGTIPYLTEKEKFEFLQHCNFELLKAVPTEKLKFYKLLFIIACRSLLIFMYKLPTFSFSFNGVYRLIASA